MCGGGAAGGGSARARDPEAGDALVAHHLTSAWVPLADRRVRLGGGQKVPRVAKWLSGMCDHGAPRESPRPKAPSFRPRSRIYYLLPTW
jgi:hypothetical protein